MSIFTVKTVIFLHYGISPFPGFSAFPGFSPFPSPKSRHSWNLTIPRFRKFWAPLFSRETPQVFSWGFRSAIHSENFPRIGQIPQLSARDSLSTWHFPLEKYRKASLGSPIGHKNHNSQLLTEEFWVYQGFWAAAMIHMSTESAAMIHMSTESDVWSFSQTW